MNSNAETIPPSGSDIDDVIAAFLNAEGTGETPDREEIVRLHPQHASALRSFWEVHDLMRPTAPDAPSQAPGEPNDPINTPRSPGDSDGPPRIRYLGEYELLEEIGRGGMGVVYKARQVKLDRIVAVKMILQGKFATPGDLRRFELEARAAAALQHPGIVAVHEIGIHEGHGYFSMDFVDGSSLAQVARQSSLPPRLAAEYVKEIAQAIGHAHRHGFLHRDLKPSNVMLDRHQHTRVTDFGLATNIHSHETLTASGQPLGTPAYMPPEQAAGRRAEIGPASDIYSIGAILYELLTGRPPFRGATTVETLSQVMNQDPVRPRILLDSLPKDLETICLKCLEKSPAKRYPSAESFIEDLRRFLAGEPILARPIGGVGRAIKWARRRPALASLFGVIAIGTIAMVFGGAWYNARLRDALSDSRHQQGIATEQRAEAERQTLLAQTRLYAFQLGQADQQWRIDPAGALAALADPQQCPPSLRDFTWHMMRARAALPAMATITTGVQALNALAFSPDFRFLYSAGDRITKWDIARAASVGELSGRPEMGFFRSLAIVADGSVIAGADDGSIRLWNSDGSPRRALERRGSIVAVAESPDLKHLAYAREAMTGRDEVCIVPLDDIDHETVIESNADRTRAIGFSLDGKSITTTSAQGITKQFEVITGKELSAPAEAIAFGSGRALAHSLQSHLIAIADAPNECIVSLWDTESHARRGQRTADHPVNVATFSPDGSLLAVADQSGIIRVWPVHPRDWSGQWIADAPISAAAYSDPNSIICATGLIGQPAILSRISESGVSERLPVRTDNWVGTLAVSQDLKRVASGDRSGKLIITDHTGSKPPLELSVGQPISSLAFSPDGAQIAVACGTRLVRLNSAGQEIGTLDGHTGEILSVAWSHDGNHLATASADGTAIVSDVHTGRVEQTLGDHQTVLRCVAFTADDRSVVAGDENGILHVWDVARLAPPLVLGRGAAVQAIAFSPDGKTLVSASRDGLIQFWATATWQLLLSSHPSDKPLRSVCFSPDGAKLLVAGDDGVARWYSGADIHVEGTNP